MSDGTGFDFVRETLKPELKDAFQQVPGTVRSIPALVAGWAKVLAQMLAENNAEGVRDVLDGIEESLHLIRKDQREGWLWYVKHEPVHAAAWAKEYERRQHLPGSELEKLPGISLTIKGLDIGLVKSGDSA